MTKKTHPNSWMTVIFGLLFIGQAFAQKQWSPEYLRMQIRQCLVGKRKIVTSSETTTFWKVKDHKKHAP